MKITQHFKTLFLIITYLFLVIVEQNYAQWSNDPTINTPISTNVGNQYGSKIVSDGSGGAIIVWMDDQSGPDSIYILAQHLNASGFVQWSDNGVTIISGSISDFTIVSDESGGIIITWVSNLTASESNIYAQRINALGAVQWNPNGVAICTTFGVQYDPNIVSDGSGGAIIAWDDNGNGLNTEDIFAQRINASGIVQWNPNGVAICTAAAAQYYPNMISDDSGGAIIAWQDARNTSDYDIYAQRINPSGNIQWAVNGAEICSASLNQTHPKIVSDNSGGAIITWTDDRDLINTKSNIYAQLINASGIVQWIADGIAICADIAYQDDPKIVSDNSGGAIITWQDTRNFTNTKFDIYAQRVNPSGAVQWINNGVAICSEIGDQVFPLIVSNNSGGAIIAWLDSRNFTNTQRDIYAQNINASGIEQWIINGVAISTANNSQQNHTIVSDNSGGAIITWTDVRTLIDYDIYAQKYPPTSPLQITKPALNSKFIAGETDTIKWTDAGWAAVNIKCITNFETPLESELILAQGIPNANSKFVWNLPDTTLSFRSKIVIENADNLTEKIESDIFRIKPYVLTRLNSDSTYYEYRKNRDQWGFSNTRADAWDSLWYSQFDYRGIDPFTNQQYSQIQGDSVFFKRPSYAHMDWISWVNTFTLDACYFSVANGWYKPTATLKWWIESFPGKWNGSCFGIAVANALAFSHKQQFQSKYQNFPAFINPITVVSEAGVKSVINELFTHQTGNPHQALRTLIGLEKTPNETLNDLKEMLRQDNSEIRTLSFLNNGGGGGHAVLAYKLKQDPTIDGLYYVHIYDNSNPNSNNHIQINTLAGNGFWAAPDWAGWGGNKWFYLRNPTEQYLVNPTLAKGFAQQSPFILDQDILEINHANSASIQIQDNLGNQTGFINNLVQLDIPGSAPFVFDNGSETPPYGYTLPADNYSVVLNEFIEDTVATFFFTGNKSFLYERSGATQTQTDRLFFDGGVSVSNPNAQTKTIKLLNLINETTQEKLFVARSLELAQNDSVKIENPDSNIVKLISYGTAKEYDLELNYVTENGIGRFGDFDVQLEANTSHTFVPVWTDLTNTELQVLVDVGNDGIIDDTLSLINQVTGIGEDQGSLLTPDSYNLAQNYPNPFNPTTKISWQSPFGSHQTLMIYDVLGNEVATLVNEYREAGRYEITFDASNLSSGIYFYRLQAGDFVESKKMILIK